MKPRSGAARNKAKRRVLFVDDDEVLLRTYARAFRHSYSVRTAWSAAAGLESACEFHPDVAVIDLNLHGKIDGIELIRQLRTSHPQTACILLSGYASVEFAAMAAHAGASTAKHKPISIDELRATIESPETWAQVRPPLLADMQRQYVEWVVQYCDGNVSRASQLLGVSRTTVYAFLKQTGRRRRR